MLVLSSPSGAGKSTLTRLLTVKDDNLRLSISVTTRPRRHSEVDGVHYHFIDLKTFRQMKESGALLESAEVHGNHYGTPRQQVEDALAAGRDVLFDIDWQGTQQLAGAMPDDLVRVFVLPPSMAELQARLERRAEDHPEVIARRLAAGRDEIRHWEEYDYVIVNDDLERSLHDVQAILAAERRRRSRQPGLGAFVERLLVEKASERA
ncbi:MAG: guanylate kinase [Bauldia sp.]